MRSTIGIWMAAVLMTALAALAGCGGGPGGPVVPDSVADGLAAAEDGARWYRKGCYHRALSAYTLAHRHLASADHLPGVALTMNSIGTVYRALGDAATAEVFFVDAAAIYQSLGDTAGWRQARVNQAAARIDAGDPTAALALLDQTDIPGQPPVAPALTNRGIALMRLGKMPEAEAALSRALDLLGDSSTPAAATAHAAMGRLLMDANRPNAAKAHLTAALALDQKAEFHIGMADDLEFLADLALRAGAAAEAVGYLKRSYSMNAVLGRSVETNRTLAKLVMAADRTGMDVRAVVGLVNSWASDPDFEGPCDQP